MGEGTVARYEGHDEIYTEFYICINCGHDLVMREDKFCSRCGKKIDKFVEDCGG